MQLAILHIQFYEPPSAVNICYNYNIKHLSLLTFKLLG